MSFQGGFVTSTGRACLALSGIPMKATLGQPQNEVAQQGGWESTLAKQILRFREHVVGEVVGDGRREVRSGTLVARDFGDLSVPRMGKEAGHGHGVGI